MAKKILICDDNLDLAKSVAMRLKASGYEVFLAGDGFQSVSLAHQKNPDLIILDIKMPAGDGCTVYKNLQSSINTKLIPVMLFSALPISEVKEKTKQLGAADCLTKPCDLSELVSKVQKILNDSTD
ncbi:MAG: response regulator [Candidatus Omnitrophica bacterium]|nr:response regulator [Candidatus Omnitrophota bacterium]